MVGLVTSPTSHLHDTGPGHPERPARLRAVLERLDSSGLMGELQRESASPADRAAILAVHPKVFLDRIEERITRGDSWVDSPDANVGPHSFEAALGAAGAALLGLTRIAEGSWRRAFVAVRPPGHHAEESLAMGFCLVNHAAIAARAAQRQHGLARVAIVDFDVHHGNGTQHIFERDPTVFYASLHQFPHYPGTGAANERGLGDGEGTTLNCPMAPGSGDRDWLRAFDEIVLPALDAFRPDLVIASAGFDAHRLDPLSDTVLTEAAYTHMSRALVQLAERHAAGRLLSLLEGGYSLEGLALSAEAHVAALVSAGYSAARAES
ncbi:MAG: histone deacetylase [Planctomycetaceae bacterium]|nr:histone deacetylase [Planctomycetaceae bacterium]